MHDIYNLKSMLMDELKEYGRKNEVNAGSLQAIDTLAHATKNLCKIIKDAEGDEYTSGGSYMRGGRSYRGSYDGNYDDSSYARGRGRNARRDGMGRYSSDGGMMELADEIKSMMQELPEDARRDAEKLVMKLEK